MSRASLDGRNNPRRVSESVPTAHEIFATLVSTTHVLVRFGNVRLGRCHVSGVAPGKMSGPRLRVLIAVAEAGSLRMGDLATLLGVQARTVTDLVDGLEKEGLLVRRPDPDDRRATLLELTPWVREQWGQLRGQYDEIGEEALSPFNGAERRQLLDLLNRLRVWISEMAEGSPREGDDALSEAENE